MKKAIRGLLSLAILLFAAAANAVTLTAGASFFNPTGVEGNGGALFSFGVGQRVDEMVLANIQVDYFNKSFTKEITTPVDVGSGGIVNIQNRVVAYNHSVKYFPLTAGAVISLPVGDIIRPYIEGRVGFGLAHVSYDYNQNLYAIPAAGRPESGTYTGFGWRIGGGARMRLGHRSALLAGMYYNGNTVSRSQNANVFSDLKMSGIGFGAGLELSGF